MIESEDVEALAQETGTATLNDGTQIRYPSRESYLRLKPTSEHTIIWKKIGGKNDSNVNEQLLNAQAQLRIEKQADKHKRAIAMPETAPDPHNNQAWVDAIAKGKEQGELPLSLSNDANQVRYFRRMSENLITRAEAIRGIEHSRRIITIEGVSKTVLYRDATNIKETLTDADQQKISNLEFQATWCVSVAAACSIANGLDDISKRSFMGCLNKLIDRNITGDESEPGKAIYKRKMQELFSILGAFFPGNSEDLLEDLSERLEAERDLLAIDEPTELVATLHKNGLDDTEIVYEIELPNTKLSPEQKTFFETVRNPKNQDSDIGFVYNFYRDLTPWQKALIRRDAPKILEENRLRPSQMQFLPMAPNFWTRYTAVKAKDQPAKVINVISRCGALSPRVHADDDGIIKFQKMQYGQVRTNFNLKSDDKLCYTSYKQNFYGPGADDSALKNISRAHDADPAFNERNPIFNIPMGRFAPISRIMNGIHHFFAENKFEDNDHDPLTEDAFSIVDNMLDLREHKVQIRDPSEHLSIDRFLDAEFNYSLGVMLTDDDKRLEKEIKLDLEQVYRHAVEIRHLRKDIIIKDNKRVAALRTNLFHELHELKTKLEKLPGITFKASGIDSHRITYQAYISG
ncbi:MAG: hypothetical protein ACHQAX_05505 [Gammaproteobacteria bacterium]